MSERGRLAGRWAVTARWTAAATLVCGAVLLAYVRPGIDRLRPGSDPGRLDLHLALTAVLDGAHVALGVVCLAALGVVVARAWGATARGVRTAAVALIGAGALGTVVTGFVVPWRDLLPWAEGLGTNRARPALVLESEGPFSELVDVRASYEPERRRVRGGSVTAAGMATLVAAHAIALPVALMGARRLRSARRSPTRKDR